MGTGPKSGSILTGPALDPGVPEPPPPSSPPPPPPPTPAAKPSVPHAAVLGDAKVTIDAPIFKVFAALTDPDRLAAWWGQDAVVEPDEGGRYETTLDMGRLEGTIVAIDGPGTLDFTWELPAEGIPVTTTVHYALSPRGPQTAVHIAHRAPKEVPGDWSALWASVLGSLKAYVESEPGAESGSPETP